jgi:putative aminopeptidase FrvX
MRGISPLKAIRIIRVQLGYEKVLENIAKKLKFEDVAKEKGLYGWKCTQGGSSDTRIWAEHGMQCVNLSAGYQHEHTEAESLDVAACYRTAKLVEGVFENASDLRRLLLRVRRDYENKF